VVLGAAVALSEAAGACVDDAVLLGGAVEEAVGGAALGGVEGACAQSGSAIARTAPKATPLNKCFISEPPTRTIDARCLARTARRFVCHLTVECLISCFTLNGPIEDARKPALAAAEARER
jgi:hypothetical protein